MSTKGRTIEMWDVTCSYEFEGCKKISSIGITQSLRASINHWITKRIQTLKKIAALRRLRSSSDPTTTSSTPADTDKEPRSQRGQDDSNLEDRRSSTRNLDESASLSEEQSISFSVLRRQPELAHFQAPACDLFLPKHLSVGKAGFVSLQYDQNEGSSLLLWKRDSTDGEFKVVSIINLRISSRRKPRVSYDGNRLIVFGEDHIGMIILVYHVSNGDTIFPAEEDSATGEHSGGVYNLSNPPQVRFANRIRHAALGGIDRLDGIQMTTNERFIIVNTKTGNLLGGGAPFPCSEGLLVIDLQDQGKFCQLLTKDYKSTDFLPHTFCITMRRDFFLVLAQYKNQIIQSTKYSCQVLF